MYTVYVQEHIEGDANWNSKKGFLTRDSHDQIYTATIHMYDRFNSEFNKLAMATHLQSTHQHSNSW